MSYNLKYSSLCIKVLNVKRFFMKVRKFVNIFFTFLLDSLIDLKEFLISFVPNIFLNVETKSKLE